MLNGIATDKQIDANSFCNRFFFVLLKVQKNKCIFVLFFLSFFSFSLLQLHIILNIEIWVDLVVFFSFFSHQTINKREETINFSFILFEQRKREWK